MTSILVTGYKAFELGIFNEKDVKLKVIKAAIRRDFLDLIEQGVEWFLFLGNLGFETWALEVANALRDEGYELRTAVIFPFENHGENWNEVHQTKLALFRNCDFVKSAYPRYEHPRQFREFNQFLLSHTDGAYLFYDPEKQTNLSYLYQMMTKQSDYPIKVLDFDDLNELAENF